MTVATLNTSYRKYLQLCLSSTAMTWSQEETVSMLHKLHLIAVRHTQQIFCIYPCLILLLLKLQTQKNQTWKVRKVISGGTHTQTGDFISLLSFLASRLKSRSMYVCMCVYVYIHTYIWYWGGAILSKQKLVKLQSKF
jgi:hypothetical protein